MQVYLAFTTFDWDQRNAMPYECTSDMSLLQFKSYHYFLYRYNLKLWNIEYSDVRNYCNECETLGHHLAEGTSVCDF